MFAKIRVTADTLDAIFGIKSSALENQSSRKAVDDDGTEPHNCYSLLAFDCASEVGTLETGFPPPFITALYMLRCWTTHNLGFDLELFLDLIGRKDGALHE